MHAATHRILALVLLASLPLKAVAAPLSSTPLSPGTYRWHDAEDGAEPLYIMISIKAQAINVYRGSQLIGEASVSTGKRGKATPVGEYPILQKRQWHRSNLYSNAPMPFMQRLTWDGIAIHAGHNPGYPASHGCIRLPHAFARRLFQLTRIGTLVEVTPDRLRPVLEHDPRIWADMAHDAIVADTHTYAPRTPYLKVDPGVFASIG